MIENNTEKCDPEVEKNWQDFWKELVTNSDGTINVDQVKKELYDFHFVMHGAGKVYDALSWGRVSKPNTDPDVVIRVVQDLEQQNINEAVKEERERIEEHIKAIGHWTDGGYLIFNEDFLKDWDRPEVKR